MKCARCDNLKKEMTSDELKQWLSDLAILERNENPLLVKHDRPWPIMKDEVAKRRRGTRRALARFTRRNCR